MAEPLLAPYISIPGQVTIGRWRLVPVRRIKGLKELAPSTSDHRLHLSSPERTFARAQERAEGAS